jgi:hypothetical protein
MMIGGVWGVETSDMLRARFWNILLFMTKKNLNSSFFLFVWSAAAIYALQQVVS